MKRPQTPQEKKQLAYVHDHYVMAEYPHGFRKTWPKKKKIGNQAHRRKTRQALITTGESTTAEDIEQRAQTIRKKPMPHKWGVVNLRERVQLRLKVRRSRLGYNFFKHPYESPYDRTPFVQFLKTLVEGQGGEAVENARSATDWLDPQVKPYSWLADRGRRQWLAAFFADEPEWQSRLAEWVARILADDTNG